MYTYRPSASCKTYHKARVFSTNELLFMEIKALILFGESGRDWWRRLDSIEKYHILNEQEPVSYSNKEMKNPPPEG